LFWTLLLLGILLFLFGVLFAQTVTRYFVEEYCVENPPCPPSKAQVSQLKVYYYFGSVFRSVFTLFKCLTGGVSWEEVTDVLAEIHGGWVALFILFIAFSFLVMLNIVTGILCTAAIESTNQDQDMVLEEKIAEKSKYIRDLQEIFHTLDQDNSGKVSLAEFSEVLSNDEESIKTYFEALDISMETAWQLFRLLDADGSNQVDLAAFVDGCLRLRGTAKSLDIHMLIHEGRFTNGKVNSLLKYIQTGLVEDVAAQITQSLQYQGLEVKPMSHAPLLNQSCPTSL